MLPSLCVGILGRRNYTGTIWDFREIIFGLPGTIGKNITASSTRKNRWDRLRPSQTVSNHVQIATGTIKQHMHTYRTSAVFVLQSSQYSLSRFQNSSWIVSADFILVSGCPNFYVTNWPIMRAVAVIKYTVIWFI